MNQPKLARKIRYHAYRARKIAEQVARAEKFDEDLCGFCARGSAILWKELTRAKLKAEIVYNPGHVFVYCEGWYVDITATQFGKGKTLVCKESTAQRITQKTYYRQGEALHPEWHRKSSWGTFSSPMSFQAWQQSNEWRYPKGIIQTEDLKHSTITFKPHKVVDDRYASNDFSEVKQWEKQKSMVTAKGISLALVASRIKSLMTAGIKRLADIGGLDCGELLRGGWFAVKG